MTEPTKVQIGDLVKISHNTGVFFRSAREAAFLPNGRFQDFPWLPLLVIDTELVRDGLQTYKIRVAYVFDLKTRKYWWINAQNVLIFAKGR